MRAGAGKTRDETLDRDNLCNASDVIRESVLVDASLF